MQRDSTHLHLSTCAGFPRCLQQLFQSLCPRYKRRLLLNALKDHIALEDCESFLSSLESLQWCIQNSSFSNPRDALTSDSPWGGDCCRHEVIFICLNARVLRCGFLNSFRICTPNNPLTKICVNTGDPECRGCKSLSKPCEAHQRGC